MRLIRKDRVYNTLDRAHPPAATVKPGETVRIETQLQSGDWLNSVGDRWGPSKSRGPNLCTVVAVEGAEPGDDGPFSPYVAKIRKCWLKPDRNFDSSGPD